MVAHATTTRPQIILIGNFHQSAEWKRIKFLLVNKSNSHYDAH